MWSHLRQVPRDITEEQLAPLFEECGEVLHLNILRTQKGQSSGMELGQELDNLLLLACLCIFWLSGFICQGFVDKPC